MIEQTIKNYEEHIKELINLLWEIFPNLVSALILGFVGWWVIKLINIGVAKFFERKDYDRTLETFLEDFINNGLKVLLFVMVITQVGVETSSLIAMLGAAGLALGLALQGSLSNFAGGILILIFKPFKVGDFISAQGSEGTVKQITVFNTKLVTFGNQEVIIPNGNLSNDKITNYSSEGVRRENLVIGISYDSSIQKAKDLIIELCEADENILTEEGKEAMVVVTELADSSVNLSIRYWTTTETFWPTKFKMIEHIKAAFDREGIEIPFPHRVMVTQK
ncbi:MAG: Small-conductance mechanosensitive channel [Flavobacteriaceae bacterium]|jgi:small conductance mechanosensitive channel|nr:mechanosensitive ion channel family protein [Flavobacteriaceae bacterium]CAI8185602.1 MAG: Small-conductance mechanosensitive channel [Flavobacteriaceae bacterium]